MSQSGSERSRRRFLQLAAGAASASLLGGCRPPAGLPAPPPPPPPSQGIDGLDSLRFHAAQHHLLYGCAVTPHALTHDATYARLVAAQSSILVAENAMKWAPMRPTPTTYYFDDADAIVAFAEQHRIKVRGHNLAWHRQLPKWFEAEANSGNAQHLLTSHIEQVAGRYAGRMHSWDVVNEAIKVEDGRPDGLRNCPWLKLLGPDYIETAFRAARAADPQALLAYNDYGIENERPEDYRKRAAVLMLLRRLKTRNVPIDALGIQCHIGVGSEYGAGLKSFMAEVRGLGLQIFLTELDVNDRKLPPDVEARDKAVAECYRSFLDLALGEPAVTVLLTWGITDRYTWLNGEDARPDHLPERCLPFDRDYKPKSAFFAIRDCFDRRTAG